MSATPGIENLSLAKVTSRILKLAISVTYFAMRSAWCWVSGRGTGLVLYYHAVPEKYAERFEEQMKMLVTHAKAIPLDAIDDLPKSLHSVAITFDDALLSFAEHAVPVLQKLKIPATVFAVVDALGTTPSWGESYYTSEERVMSDRQLRVLPTLIQVGSHTLSHPHLPAMTEEVAKWEITESRHKLETLLQKPVPVLSFPYGEFNDSVVAQCRAAGYERVFSTNPALLRDGSSEFVVGRVAADPWDWTLEFRLKMLGGYCWQSYLRSLKLRLLKLFSREKKADSAPLRTGESQT
jgi:peptidoglycan/xylan/chitin deacetylase (PgdA/CDA1 family)